MPTPLQQAWLDALAWVMTQPGLIEDLPGGTAPLLSTDDPRLQTLLRADPSGLMTLLQAPRAHKLGIAFEALMLWGLEQGLGYRCIARDIQIQDGKRTMGALDFILEAPDGAHEHWELSYKLFLQHDTGLGWSSWLGPRGRDRLDAKLNRMLSHQLPLSQTPQAKARLASLGVAEIHRQRLMIQGVLFSPWNGPPQRATRGHLTAQGRWLRSSQLGDLIQSDPEARWVQRERPLWFGPCSDISAVSLVGPAFAEAVTEADLERTLLWTRLGSAAHPETMFIVVPEAWGA